MAQMAMLNSSPFTRSFSSQRAGASPPPDLRDFLHCAINLDSGPLQQALELDSDHLEVGKAGLPPAGLDSYHASVFFKHPRRKLSVNRKAR